MRGGSTFRQTVCEGRSGRDAAGKQRAVEGPVRRQRKAASVCAGPAPSSRQVTPLGTADGLVPGRSAVPVRWPPSRGSGRFSQDFCLRVLANSVLGSLGKYRSCPAPLHSPTSADPEGALDSGMKQEGTLSGDFWKQCCHSFCTESPVRLAGDSLVPVAASGGSPHPGAGACGFRGPHACPSLDPAVPPASAGLLLSPAAGSTLLSCRLWAA